MEVARDLRARILWILRDAQNERCGQQVLLTCHSARSEESTVDAPTERQNRWFSYPVFFNPAAMPLTVSSITRFTSARCRAESWPRRSRRIISTCR